MSEEVPRYKTRDVVNGRMMAFPMTEYEPVDTSERARKAHEEALERFFTKPTPDATKAPPHYRAQYRTNGVEPGTDRVEWDMACRGPDAVVSWCLIELSSKVQRLGHDTRTHEQNIDDLFKIEQAVAVLRRIWEV